MNFEQFEAWRSEKKKQGWLDLGATNLYQALGGEPGLEPIDPMEEPLAKHRCHLGEAFERRLRTGRPEAISVCLGVRDALAGLFEHLAKQGRSAALPSDVYPRYGQLARQAGLGVEEWSAREARAQGFGEAIAIAGSQGALLVCDPLKPWGGQIEESDGAELEAWAKAGGLLIIDAAYGLDPSPWRRRAIEEGWALVIGSISKGWLEPWRAGVCVAPRAEREWIREAIRSRASQEEAVRVGRMALDRHPERPRLVAEAIQARWARAIEALAARGVQIDPPREGYFLESEKSQSWWASREVIAAPASVWGSKAAVSLITPLGLGRSR